MIEEKIKNELKDAMKSGNHTAVSTLRLVMSGIKNKRIEEMVPVLSDEKVIGVIQKMVRQHKESIDQFEKGGRPDLAQKEKEEMAILEGYMPAALSEEEISNIIDEAIAATGASSMKEMGLVMKEITAKVAGRADGKTVSDKVKEKLLKK